MIEGLDRFVGAQEPVYRAVVTELRAGRKKTHWMWFIFPQIAGLGTSDIARYYALENADEARAYLSHAVLGRRLLECSEIILGLHSGSASAIFGHPDDVKLKSSMTLFASISAAGSVFEKVLERYFDGVADQRTLSILKEQEA